MSDINEQRQAQYLELIQALLQCPQGEEDRVLADSPELVDEGLVMALLATAQMPIDRQDPDEVGTIEWLVNFAEHLAQKLGLDIGEDNKIAGDEEFFLELLQAVANSEGDGQIIHQFFDEHLTNLNANLLTIFSQQAEMLLARKGDPEWQSHSHIASTLVNLAIDLHEFPRGDRSLNIELAIVGYQVALEVYTRAHQFPEDWAMTQMNLGKSTKRSIQ